MRQQGSVTEVFDVLLVCTIQLDDNFTTWNMGFSLVQDIMLQQEHDEHAFAIRHIALTLVVISGDEPGTAL